VSGIVDRITAVLREHRYSPLLSCCPSAEDHEAHVAERVVAELQLTEEWAHKGRAFPDDDEDEDENERSRCCCGHGKFLHREGACFATVRPCGCFATVRPCGCRSYEAGRVVSALTDRIADVQSQHLREAWFRCSCGWVTSEVSDRPNLEWPLHAAERVEAELPRFGEIREAYEFYQLDSDKAMAAQIFAQQVGEILKAES
jgi:hypothetical protein